MSTKVFVQVYTTPLKSCEGGCGKTPKEKELFVELFWEIRDLMKVKLILSIELVGINHYFFCNRAITLYKTQTHEANLFIVTSNSAETWERNM